VILRPFRACKLIGLNFRAVFLVEDGVLKISIKKIEFKNISASAGVRTTAVQPSL